MTDTSWRTPKWLLDLVREVNHIGFDPCTTEDNPVGAPAYCTPVGLFCLDVAGRVGSTKVASTDGLATPWGSDGLVFANPPYSRKESPAWADKIAHEAALGTEIIALLPARVDTSWWHNHIAANADAVCFLRGRPRHVDAAGNADGAGKFPSAVAYFGDRVKVFARVFSRAGWVVVTRPESYRKPSGEGAAPRASAPVDPCQGEATARPATVATAKRPGGQHSTEAQATAGPGDSAKSAVSASPGKAGCSNEVEIVP